MLAEYQRTSLVGRQPVGSKDRRAVPRLSRALSIEFVTGYIRSLNDSAKRKRRSLGVVVMQ